MAVLDSLFIKAKARSMISSPDDWERLCTRAEQCYDLCPGGCVLEFGVAAGGSLALLASIFHDRLAIGVDCFEGLSPPSEKDGNGWEWFDSCSLRCIYNDTLLFFRSLGLTNIMLCHSRIETWEFEIPKLAFCHIDLNFYYPTILAIQKSAPRMVPSSLMCLDDFDYTGVKNAISDTGFLHHGIKEGRQFWIRF
jgi:hypothetical protein